MFDILYTLTAYSVYTLLVWAWVFKSFSLSLSLSLSLSVFVCGSLYCP